MRRLLAVAALCLAAPAVGQPVAGPTAPTVDAALRADLGLAAPAPAADREAPPALYWAGVGFDVAAVAGGTYLLVQGARLLAASDDVEWAGQVPAVLFGTLGVTLGALAAGFGGYDLVRVARGADPMLARALDPSRLPPGGTPNPPRPPY